MMNPVCIFAKTKSVIAQLEDSLLCAVFAQEWNLIFLFPYSTIGNGNHLYRAKSVQYCLIFFSISMKENVAQNLRNFP